MVREKIYEVQRKRFLFKVEKSHSHHDYQKYEDLRMAVWGDPKDRMPGQRNMVCENFYNEGSALFIGVFIEDDRGGFPEDRDHLVGFSYGFVGVKDKSLGFRNPENLLFYSQYTGVEDAYRHFGLGLLIKEFQRDVLVEDFGIDVISCTFDPLTGVNAYRNIHLLGMEVIAYNRDHYGDYGGKLNRLDVPCDRFCVHWHLSKETRRPSYDLGRLVNTSLPVICLSHQVVQGRDGPLEMAVLRDVDLGIDEPFILVEIPFDFYAVLQQTDVSDEAVRRIPKDWREATRRVFLHYFDEGYRVVDFRLFEQGNRRRDFYVLHR